MPRTRADQLRALLSEIDAKILRLVDDADSAHPALVSELGALEATRSALWRLLAVEDSRRRL